MSIPNLISLARLLLVPVIVSFMIDAEYTLAFWLCIVAGLSDAVDGFIAKHYNKASAIGAYLDPLADKALLISLFVTLGLQGHLYGWLVIMVVSRDILIIGAVMLSYLISHPLTIKALVISKANTAAQIVLAIVVMADLGLHFVNGVQDLIVGLSYFVAVTTGLSFAFYFVGWVRSVATWEKDEGSKADMAQDG